MHATGPQSPPSPAVTAATELLASTTTPEDTAMTAHGDQANIDQNTEEFPQAVSVPLEQDMDRSKESTQISSQLGIKDGDTSEQEGDPSSRKENKSPVKAVLRLEDSIEAIDKFEEEIERVGDLIPAISNSAQSPKDLEKQEKPVTVARKETSTQNSSTPKTRKDSKPCNPKAAALVKKKAAVHPRALATLPASKVDPKARQVSDSSTTSDKPPVAARKRVSAIHKAPFVPAKSTKPPTRSNFELPGEAVARKLREAREERMKREEEEKAKKPAFKARPVRISQGPVVKATATSRVRISMAKGEIPAVAAAKDVTTKPKVAPRPSDVSALGKRLSTVSVNKRSAPAPAHTSARVMRGPPSGTVRQSVNATDAAQLRAKGKEVFNRGKVEQDEREKMKKEKEDAAKKARAEAAERGRIASREWAEKQKAKKMAEKQAKGETPTIGEASLPAA